MKNSSHHSRRFVLSLLASSALLWGAIGAAAAPFTLIDNFEATEGPLDGRLGLWVSNGGEIVVDPATPTNRVIMIGGAGERGSHIPATIANGQTGTMFFRLRVDTDNANVETPVYNWSAGMSDVAISGDGAFGDYEAQLNQNRDEGNFLPEEVRIRDAAAFVSLTPLQPEVWYKVWLVINNATDTTEVHMEGGQFPTRTQVSTLDGVTSFVFRNSGGGPVANDLVRFFIRVSGAHAGNLYFDDLWLNPAEANLTDPTTTPVSDLPPVLTDLNPKTGTAFHPAEQGLSFHVTTADPGGIPTETITVILNGTDVTSALAITGSPNDRAVTYSGLQPETVYTAVITARDASGREREATLSFDTLSHYVLPAQFAYPLSAAKTDAPGFTARVTQFYDPVVFANSEARAEAQLAGEMIDPSTGAPYVEYAIPGGNPDGSYDQNLINWNIDAGGFGVEAGSFQAPTAPDEPIPGVTTDYVDNMAAEILTYLELPAGLHTMGVNSDDGFVVSTGVHHQDLIRRSLGRFDGGRGVADTTFQFRVETPGVYPFRLVWYQGNGGAALEWFSVDEGGQKILINDRSNPNAILAWRALSAPVKPYVSAITPGPGEGQIPLDANISITIQDGGTQVLADSVELSLNGQAVTPTVNKTGSATVVSFNPPSNLERLSTNTLSLAYSDAATPPNMRTVTSFFVTLRARTEFNGFTLIDDFEGALGPLNGRFGEWIANGAEIVADPVAPNNRVAGWVGGTGDRGSHIEATIPEGQSGTLFFRLMTGSDNSDLESPVLNWSVGMSDVAISGDGAFGDFEVQLNQNRDDGNLLPEEVRVRDFGSFLGVTTLQTQTWYKVWLRIDNAADTYQVYAEGGQFPTPTLLQTVDGLDTFGFRNSQDVNDLVRFFVRLAGTHAGALYLDDLWVDPAKINQIDPTTSKPADPIALTAARTAAGLVISWPAADTDNHVLETTPTLSPAAWSAVTTQPAVEGGQKSVTVATGTGTSFYRLRAP